MHLLNILSSRVGKTVRLQFLFKQNLIFPFSSSSRYLAQVNSICEVAKTFDNRIAIKDAKGEYSYRHLVKQSDKLTRVIAQILSLNGKDKTQNRIACLCPNDVNYVLAQWATWKSGHVSVPLHASYPTKLLKYFVEDSQSSIVLTTHEFRDKLSDIENVDVVVLEDDLYLKGAELPSLNITKHLQPTTPALILYTSGTTGLPKGVVITHGNISYMLDNMIDAWKWTKNDVILHTLPLHHTHGLINALLCPLLVGACVVMLPKFTAEKVWSNLLDSDPNEKSVNIFMAVPTIYSKLVEEYEKKYSKSNRTKAFIKAKCTQQIRLMVSGSASLPTSVFEKWKEITGHELLERYGMTEIGMALTNPLNGKRKPGFVGNPFPTVSVCITKPNFYSSSSYDVIVQSDFYGTKVTPGMEKEEGELWVKGPSVFKEYWNKPEESSSAFTKDNWFKTGDTAAYIDGSFKILGRTSVDIIKSGGYKISALDIERVLLTHPNIAECVVVGLNDVTWGQKVAAVVVLKTNKSLELSALKLWCLERMPSYSVPTVLLVVKSIERNAMGKVNKKQIVKDLFPNQS